MKFHQYKYSLYFLVFSLLIAGFSACDTPSMHDPYEEFIKGGEIIYAEAPDSVTVHPGKNRIKLTWPMPADPRVSRAKVFWHNGTDSIEVFIDSVRVEDRVDVMLTDMPEGAYTFDIYHYYDEGSSSIKTSAMGKVYGETYINSLLPRLVDEALYANDTLKVTWNNADEGVIASEISYTDNSGTSRLTYVPKEDESTIVTDFDFSNYNSFQHRTLYKPDSTAIDTFYTARENERVLGPRVALSKNGWTATASSYDERHGTARAPGSAIDNDLSTIWVNSIDPQTYYPHTITVDMGSVMEDIYGLSFDLDKRKEAPKTIEIKISEDGVNWTAIGIYNLEYTGAEQYVDFPEGQNVRFFEVKTTVPQGGTNNIVIPEIGTYRR